MKELKNFQDIKINIVILRRAKVILFIICYKMIIFLDDDNSAD